MIENIKNIEVSSSSEKSFGIVFAVVFLLIALYPLLDSRGVYIWALVTSGVFVFLAYVFPKVLSVPNKLWFKLGMLIGSIVTPIIMTIIYIFTVLPIGIFMKVIKKDLLNQKIDANAESYWIERDKPVGSMKKQF